jgi:polysaccharide biosynthesis protein PslG
VNWSWVQYGGPSSFDWSEIDQEVRSIVAAKMSPDLIIDDTPQWARAGDSIVDWTQPASASAFATFAGEVAARYGPMGVSTYEIWNEPNIQMFWEPAPNPSLYSAMLVDSYSAIKTVQSDATVISGGLSPATTDGTDYSPVDFLTQMYANGAAGSFDALGAHAYSYPTLPDSYEAWSGWSGLGQTSPSLRSVMAANGDEGKQIWITEVGAPSAGPNGVGVGAQAEEVTQAVQNAESTPWIGALFVYTYQDTTSNPDYFGLVNADGRPKPAWAALASAVGASPACALTSQSAVTVGLPCEVDAVTTNSVPPVATPEIGAPLLLPLSALTLGGIGLAFKKRRLARGSLEAP